MSITQNHFEVDILLATYQGEKYIEPLIQSLIDQTFPGIRILIRDDGSQDRTLEILQKFAKMHPHKISLITDNRNLGVIGNFSELLKNSRAKYVLFADQDDYWLPHKVEVSIDRLKKMEEKYGVDSPLLVHTDLLVADKDLQVIDRSFWNYAWLNPKFTGLNRLLVQNCVTGCTMAMNRALVNLSCPVPKTVVMHDWWIALLATCFGQIEYLREPTLFYRQHSSNILGANRPNLYTSLKKFILIKIFFKKKDDSTRKKASDHLNNIRNQALTLLQTFENDLGLKERKILQAFCDLQDLSFLRQRKLILQHRFFRHSKLYTFFHFCSRRY